MKHVNYKTIRSFITIMALVAILGIAVMPLSTAQAISGGTRPTSSAIPFGGKITPEKTVNGAVVMLSPGVSSGIAGGANWLMAQQDAGGGYPWTAGGSIYANTQGPTAQGMMKAYSHDGDGAYSESAVASATYLITAPYPVVYTDDDPRFGTHNPLFLEDLSLITADTTYSDFVQTWFWDKLSSSTYGENNDMDAAAFGAAVVVGRTGQGLVALSPWDLSATAIAAHVAGEFDSRDALMASILAGLNGTSAGDSYDTLGLAGAIWASALTGVDLDPVAGVYASANTSADLAAILAGMTLADSPRAWLWGSNADPSDPTNGDTQTTAYALMALNAFDQATYLSQIEQGTAFIRSVQDVSGQFLAYTGAATDAAGGGEVHGEALAALVIVAPNEICVDDDFVTADYGDTLDGTACNMGPVTFGYDAFTAVADGVDAIHGGTIHVANGLYEEQVLISGKDISIVGQSLGAVIQAPVATPVCAVSSYDWHGIICITDGANATIDTLTIDGAGRGNTNNRFIGVAFRNAGGTLQNSAIVGIQDTPFSGVQHGVGLNVYNDDDAVRSLSALSNTFSTFQKNAIAIATFGLSELDVLVDGNQIQGVGATEVTAQNGIQVYEAGGTLNATISNNIIDGIAYDNTNATTKWVATSILNYYADVAAINNTVTGGHLGIYYYDGAGEIGGNDLTIEKIGVYAFGIIASDPPDAIPSPFGDITTEKQINRLESLVSAPLGTLVVSVTNNTVLFNGIDNTSTYGIEADAGFGELDLQLVISGNKVNNFEVGIEIYQCEDLCSPGIFTSVNANYNDLSENTYGLRSNASYLTVNAENNWWGSTNGPEDSIGTIELPITPEPIVSDMLNILPTGLLGNLVSGYVDYFPWDISPLVVSITRADANPTGAASVDFIVTFSEAVIEVDATDFSLTTTGVVGASITSASGSGASYTVTVNTGSGNGTIRLDVNASGTNIEDLTGNPFEGGFTAGDVYDIVKTIPTVTDIIRTGISPTSNQSVDFTVTFSEAVTGVDETDFVLTTSGPSGVSIISMSGSGDTYTVTVDTGVGNGSIRLDVVDDDTIGSATAPLGGVGAGNGDYTNGEEYYIVKSVSTMGDFNGDGKDDVAIFHPSDGSWVIQDQGTYYYGLSGDIPVPADYDGNGTDDIAIFRPSNGTWYIRGQGSYVYGQAGDIPVPADYNGDGKDDIAVFRASNHTWYIYGVGSFLYGDPGDIPVPSDYNGDGITDIAVFRSSTHNWHLRGIGVFHYGDPGDVPVVPGDYNGDGKADIGIWRPNTGNWHIYAVGVFAYGENGDIPVPGDYDGDGQFDMAVWRPSTGTWYLRGIGSYMFGVEGDIPVAPEFFPGTTP